MFNFHTAVLSEVLEYTLFMVPTLVACVLNLSVFIIMSRSEKLQQSKVLRQNTYLHISLGCLLDFAFYTPAFFASEYEVFLRQMTTPFIEQLNQW